MRCSHRSTLFILPLLALPLVMGAPARAQVAVATYLFNNNLNAEEAGKPLLANVDPLGLNHFESATVFGQGRTVFRWDGNPSPTGEQAGLSLNTTGLVPTNNYSAELVFSFDSGSGWRRILDVQNRASDSGFYVDPNSRLDVFPVVAGINAFTAGAFHHVVLTSEIGTDQVRGYLDGTLEFTTNTSVMHINNAGNLMNLFLDNTVGGGQGEFSDGRIALFRLYDVVLTPGQVATISGNLFPPAAVPEPSALGLLISSGITSSLFFFRRKKAV